MRPHLLAALLLAPALAACLAPAEPTSPTGVAGVFSATSVFPGTYDTSGPWSRVLVPGLLPIRAPVVETLTSDADGAAIQLAFVRPDAPDGARFPVVVLASVYLDDLAGSPIERNNGTIHSSFLIENLVPRGYAVAFVASRGTAGSGGCVTFGGPEEIDDVAQAVRWLATQPWSTGAVAMMGHSYEGALSWAAAARALPELRTLVVLAGPSDVYEAAFRNGTALSGAGGIPIFLNARSAPGRSAGARLETVCPELAVMTAALAVAGATASDPTGIYAARAWRDGIEQRYRGSVLLLQGLQDADIYPHASYPWIVGLEARGVAVKHILGQWQHATWPDTAHLPPGAVTSPPNPTPRADWAEILVRWLDRELRGEDVDVGPRVQVADSSMRWRSEERWPPPDAEIRTFHLAADGALAPEPSSAAAMLLVPDPGRSVVAVPDLASAAPECASCAWFRTQPAVAEWRFAGLPQVHVTVEPLAPRGHLTAFLYVEDGAERSLVGWGQMDLRFAAGGREPRDVTPGTPLLLAMELEPLDVVVPARATLALALAPSGYGHSDNAQSILLYHGAPGPGGAMRLRVGEGESVVRVLAFERSADDARFFTPPGVQR